MIAALSHSLPPEFAAIAADPVRARALSRQIERERCRRSLYEFVKSAWPHALGGETYIDSWHIRAICDHCQAVSEGRIRHLIINVPPRHSKSLIVAVFWPAWDWIRTPHRKFLTASYAASLATRDNVRMRRLISADWYRSQFGDAFDLAGDQNEKKRFENTAGGYRIATSVNGSVIGEGGDIQIIDDPHNPKQAMSETMRTAALDWYDQSWTTRGNNPKLVARVLIMQRLHDNDMSGHILEQEPDTVHLCIAAEYDGPRGRHTIGNYDPRTLHGELICPARFGPAEVASLKISLGTFGTAGQLQQRPSPIGGGIIKLDWFGRYGVPMQTSRIGHSWDCAQKTGELNDYTAGLVFGILPTRYQLRDVVRERLEYPDLVREIRTLAERDLPEFILIEDKGHGTAAIQELRRNTRLPIVAIEPIGDKIMRASTEAATIEAGNFELPVSAPWLHDFEAELTGFPNAPHDDQIDGLTQFSGFMRARSTATYAGSTKRGK